MSKNTLAISVKHNNFIYIFYNIEASSDDVAKRMKEIKEGLAIRYNEMLLIQEYAVPSKIMEILNESLSSKQIDEYRERIFEVKNKDIPNVIEFKHKNTDDVVLRIEKTKNSNNSVNITLFENNLTLQSSCVLTDQKIDEYNDFLIGDKDDFSLKFFSHDTVYDEYSICPFVLQITPTYIRLNVDACPINDMTRSYEVIHMKYDRIMENVANRTELLVCKDRYLSITEQPSEFHVRFYDKDMNELSFQVYTKNSCTSSILFNEAKLCGIDNCVDIDTSLGLVQKIASTYNFKFKEKDVVDVDFII